MNLFPAAPLPFPARKPDAHKGSVGKTLLIGGSRGMAGSIALSSIAALKTGSGLVSAAIPDRCLETVAAFHPAIMTIAIDDTVDGQFAPQCVLPGLCTFDAIGCGPGMRTGAGSTRIVEMLISKRPAKRDQVCVLDADALNVIAEQNWFDSPALPHRLTNLVLTPHPGELQRLTGSMREDRDRQIEAASELCRRFGFTIIVKGAPTVVVSAHDDNVTHYTNTTGNPGMATAGSGDVLTGIITSLAGQGLCGWDASRLGVFLHGMAGDLAAQQDGMPGVTALDIVNQIPKAIQQLTATE